ncbi:MAG: hypothetical protein ABEK01_05270 [Candidatus Nanohaloarchaea archaeon]
MPDYEPGICNIGKAEKRKRYALGIAGIAAATSWTVFSPLEPLSSSVVAGMLFALGSEGFIQGYMGFCAGFAHKGIYDVSGTGDERNSIEDPLARKQDLVKAFQIHLYSLTAGIAAASVLYIGGVF